MKHFLFFLSITAMLFSCKMNNSGGNSSTNDRAAKNEATVQDFYNKVFNAHNAAMCDSFMTTNAIDHSPDPGQGPGLDGVKKDLKEFFDGFPDQKVTIMAMTADSNTVMAQYNIKGSNTGAFMGMPATNKKVDVDGIDVFKFDNNGKITDRWGYNQQMKFMQQMGMMPSDSAMMQMKDKKMDEKEMTKK